MDRRTSLKWVLTAAATLPLGRFAPAEAKGAGEAKPYGTDPNLLEIHSPGELWPLTLTPQQRKTATVLCDTIIPADDSSPSASAVGVVEFIDEWISAPYARQRGDRKIVLAGLAWIDAEARRRFSKPLAALSEDQCHGICEDICYVSRAKPKFAEAAKFFARFRDLVAGGFYTTPEGRKDLQYVGNVPLKQFDGPPLEVLRKVGLA